MAAVLISLLLGLFLMPSCDGPRLYGRIYLPLFVCIVPVAIYAKKKRQKITYRASLMSLIALPFISAALLDVIF